MAKYIVNDDDLNDWYRRLYKINKDVKNDQIEYVLYEIENEFTQHIPDENMKAFLKHLRKE